MAGTGTHYSYDEDGHCIAIRESETRHFLYDGRGLLIKETAPDDTLHYRYDAAGRLVEVTSATSHVQLEYDLRDRVVREWLNGSLITRQFDDTARTVTRTLAREDERDDALTSTFSYSAAGELQQVQLPDGAELTLVHDAAGREASRSGGAFVQHREYDVMGWLTREMSGQQQDGRLHASQTREYLYDGTGNLAGVRHNRETRGYRLDATGRVLSVLNGGAGRAVETDEAYRYTRNGLPQDTARLTEWQAGRLTQHDDTHYQYDKAGRLIRKQVVQPGYRPQVWHYRWDSRNQLRVVDTPTGERWFYRYDPFGRRTGKRCEQTQDDIRYLWDGDQIAEVRHYRNGALVSRRHWVHNGWELLVQQRQNADGRWETDFVTSSQNGEPQALYRPDGTLRWQAPKSTLWGQRPGSTEDPADPGLAFAGQYRDTESGLCYNRFRYYDPTGGCYVSPDPIGVLGGENNYGYVHNPMDWVDPFGLAECSKELAQRKAQELRDSATSNTQRSKLPRATSAVVDKATGKVYYGFSGRPLPNSIHPHLAERMPSPSLERWPVQNCAEFKGVNQALLDGARLENLEVHTVKTISGEAFPMCSNCQTTIFGTIVTSG
ncbi:RHS repeat-associated core domain-containing protein [Pectobacterium carotovorum]|uniref:RHS repeat-associated core domain-containing protein n=1 Tax=Pectobacterium carotovorum TaxID=554 RepID=UPI0039F715A8